MWLQALACVYNTIPVQEYEYMINPFTIHLDLVHEFKETVITKFYESATEIRNEIYSVTQEKPNDFLRKTYPVWSVHPSLFLSIIASFNL